MKYYITLLLAALLFPALAHAQEESTTIGGYGSFDLTKSMQSMIVGGKSTDEGSIATLNSPRIVLFFSHSFSDWIAFSSEYEIENLKIAGDALGGEAAWEQFYLNFTLSKPFNVRAGLFLVPVGIINETHEPPTFNGVTRPLFDEILIPTTWRDIGVGFFGDIAQGWNYRVYLMGSREASRFTHTEGVTEDSTGNASREGQFTNPNHLAITGKLEYTGVKGLTAAASFFYGGTMDTLGYTSGGVFSTPMLLLGLNAQYNIGDLYLRGEFATISIDADPINTVFHSAIDSATGQRVYDTPNLVPKSVGGFWLEAAYNVLPWFNANTAAQVLAFVRYENFDLNQSLAAHAVQDNTLLYNIITAGLTYKPIYNIAVKFDWQSQSTKAFANSENGASAYTNLDLGIGWMF